ncbi:MAG: PspA/IM30 family protein [Cyanobacteria bacterium SZAS-4]|nr:PspA/IM30 family protein [Cyanobacteria bacterium SZAS-4]
MFERLGNLFRAMFNAILGKMEDPQIMLEQTYQDLQSNLIQVRQAVAQAIATEKQLEQQLQKNKDQAETWQNRAAMAVQQGNDDLAKQALQRRQQYVQAANDLETQLKSQRESTVTLRQRLTDLEAEVQKAYTKKQVLIARDKAAQATSKANEILSKTTSSGAMSVMEKMETKVLEREAKAAAMSELSGDNLDKQFKSFEGKSDVEMELLALKQSMGVKDNTIQVKEPVLIETKSELDEEHTT